MKKEVRFWAIDILAFALQLILGIASMIFGWLSSNEIFIPIGLAIGCGGLGSLSSVNAYLRRKKERKYANNEMFDERANLISNNANSVSFKLTIIALEVALLVSILPYKLPYYLFSFCIGGIMFLAIITNILARVYYSDKY